MNQPQLFYRIKSGDTKAFEELFNQLYPSMCVVAKNYLGNKGDAEDVAQEAFIKLWKVKAEYTDINSLKSFLYVLVKNLSLNHLKREKIQNDYCDSFAAKESGIFFQNEVIEEETYRIIKQAVDALPSQSSKIIQLSLQGLQNQEIAERLGISVNTVKTLKYNSLKSLKTTLKDYFFILAFLLGEV